MTPEEIQELKEHLLELDENIKFDDANEDKLIGYAERFACEIIPLYNGVNTFLSNPDEAINSAMAISDKVCLFPDLSYSVVGYIVLEQGGVALLHDKEVILNSIAEEYEKYGMDIDEDENESYYSNALEWYEYNIIGTGLSDMTTPCICMHRRVATT